MRLKTLITRLRRPPPQPLITDWTVGWSLRDLADLPPHHPRSPEPRQ